MAQIGSSTSVMTLDALVAQLTQAHGASLIGVVLYGSSASNEAIAGQSDHNVLVIVEAVTIETLRALGQTARAWQEAGNPAPLELTRREWLGSADIFPMEYADILERHRVLHGTFPLEGVSVRLGNLRLQVEQEALAKLLRLRRAVMLTRGDVSRQRNVMRESLSAILSVFRSVLRLHGERPARDAAEVIAHTATHCGLDPEPFASVLRLVKGDGMVDRDVEPTLARYLYGVESLVAYLDQFTLADEQL